MLYVRDRYISYAMLLSAVPFTEKSYLHRAQ